MLDNFILSPTSLLAQKVGKHQLHNFITVHKRSDTKILFVYIFAVLKVSLKNHLFFIGPLI